MRGHFRLLLASLALLATPAAAQVETVPAAPAEPPAASTPPPGTWWRGEAVPPAPESRAPRRLRVSPSCRGLPANDPRDLFQLSALCERSNSGDAQASYDLGRIYGSGDGVPKDPALALSFLRLAAAQGHPDARAQIAALEAGQALPPGVPPPRANAAPPPPRAGASATKPLTFAECTRLPMYQPDFAFRLRELCERMAAGDAEAYFALGNVLDAGRLMPRNEALAVRLFRTAAQLGNRPARIRLASMGYPQP
jgi:TPR repeat protein